MTTQSFGSDIAVSLYDWAIDSVRILAGREPRPPVVTLWEFLETPIVGVPAQMRISTRRAEYVHLGAWQDAATLFDGAIAPSGIVNFTPLSPGPITLRLTLESRHAARMRHAQIWQETKIEPKVFGPPITDLILPSEIHLGENLVICWAAAAAQQMRIAVINDGNICERICPPVGEIALRPTRAGKLIVRFAAENGWAATGATRVVRVIARPPKITLLTPAVQCGLPGTKVRFEWQSEGAREVWFVAPMRGLTKLVTGEGALETRFGIEPEEFHLVSRPFHGSTDHSVTLRLLPSPFASLCAPE